jgi:hypothetical protein
MLMKKPILLSVLLLILSVSVFAATFLNRVGAATQNQVTGPVDTATFASGCFWCGEAKFSQLKGVLKVTSGYTGGHVADPSYELVSRGNTGHAEAFNVVYDSSVITYDELLEAFFYLTIQHSSTDREMTWVANTARPFSIITKRRQNVQLFILTSLLNKRSIRSQ